MSFDHDPQDDREQEPDEMHCEQCSRITDMRNLAQCPKCNEWTCEKCGRHCPTGPCDKCEEEARGKE
jgi:hypothetical protein